MKSWQPGDFCLHLNGWETGTIADAVFEKVFRTSLDQPGFAILMLDPALTSHQQRRLMVDLKEELSRRHERRWQESLKYLSLGRFDQQASTKLHLDGAPDRSFLMLGYEATKVRSEFSIADFSCCATDLALTPAEFLQRHNPMFGPGAELLHLYTTTIASWDESRPRIVVINNSSSNATFGVMHGAVISQPQSHLQRIINSTMIAPACFAANNAEAQVTEFVSTDRISGPIEMATPSPHNASR